jgi:hypothetical protein
MSAKWYKIPQREPITDRLPLFFHTTPKTKRRKRERKPEK